ncbi:hypothetical protein M758_1G186800 [Ceratodon purpureus]|nr:hypothetical protein M758_1G186800 [Ceratodon purpureus]
MMRIILNTNAKWQLGFMRVVPSDGVHLSSPQTQLRRWREGTKKKIFSDRAKNRHRHHHCHHAHPVTPHITTHKKTTTSSQTNTNTNTEFFHSHVAATDCFLHENGQ